MNFKRHWNKNYGCDSIYSKENSACKWLEVDALRMKEGESSFFDEKDKEYALVILGGKCSVYGTDFNFINIGKRKNSFDGAATAVYIPKNEKFEIKAVTEVSIMISKAPAINEHKPVLILPENVIIKELGKTGWKRQAHFIVDERVEADMIYVGEAFVDGGNWASYPPHKHDESKMPKEGILEEIYYFEYNKPSGFGIQKVYTKDNSIDETYTVKSGDFVEIPKGYHPCCCAPGYKNYYLWIMAGKDRGFFMSFDPEHLWLNDI